MGEPAPDRVSGHYFDASPSSRSAPKEIRLDLPDLSVTLATDRGVFSPDRIDTGTKHLLLDGPAPAATGTLVDLGCGYGAIACDEVAFVPLLGKVGSLNVATAASIALYELRRREWSGTGV